MDLEEVLTEYDIPEHARDVIRAALAERCSEGDRRLGARLHALEALCRLARLIEPSDEDPARLLLDAAALLPQALRWPELARIGVGAGDGGSPCADCPEPAERIRCELRVSGRIEGEICLCYRGLPAEAGGEAFLPEEIELVRTFAGRAGRLLTLARAQAEEAREGALLTALLDSIPDTVYFKDRERRFTRVNPAQAVFLGVGDPAEAIGRTDLDFFAAPHAEQAMEDEARLLETGEPILDKTELVRCADDVTRVMSTTKVALRDARGGVVGLVGVSRDITERQAAEDAVRSARARTRAYLDLAPVMMVSLDAQGRVLMANREACRILGYGETDLLGADWFELCLPVAARERVREAFGRVLAGEFELVSYFENLVATKDGAERLIGWHNAILRGPGGAIEEVLSCGEDITDRRADEDRLAQALLFSQEIINSAGDGIAVLDAELRTLIWNPAMEQFTGVPAARAVGRSVSELFPDLARRGIEARLRSALTGAVVRSSTETPFRPWAGGPLGWFVGSYAPHRNREGGIVGAIAVIRDVSERRQSEDRDRLQRDLAVALIGAESLDEALRLCLGTAVATAAADCGAIYVTDPATGEARLAVAHGLPPAFAERVGHIPPEWLAWLEARGPAYGRAAEAGLPPEAVDVLTAEGIDGIAVVPVVQGARVVACVNVASRSLEGVPPGARTNLEAVAALVGSVVARFSTAESLRRSEEQLRLLVESAPEAIFVQSNYRFAYLNPAAVALFGADGPDALVGKPVLEHFAPAFRERVMERMRLLNEERRAVPTLEEVCLRPDGVAVPVEVSAVPFTYQGQSGALVFVRDITERKQSEEARRGLEAQLQRIQRLESIGVLAGGIAHDFNNVLAGIMGFAEMASDELDPTSPAHSHLQNVLAGAERARELIRQVLTFSRQTQLERRPLHLHLLLKEALRFMRASLPTTVEIRERIDPGTPPVEADATQIHQVVANLCTNAEYAMRPKGGVLEVSLSSVVVDEDRAERLGRIAPGRYAVISVTDTGCGMDGPTRERIFDPFFTTKPPGEGSGLGLATSFGIVSGHGGAITVQSEPSAGSSFQVFLPCLAEEVDPLALAGAAPAPRGAERLLFVDDERVLVRMGEAMLASLGYRVTAVTSSTEALALLERDPEGYDLLVTDHTMPILTGVDLAAAARAVRPDLPVLLMTGFRQRVDDEEAAAAGVGRILAKPYTKTQLGEAVREAIDAARAETSAL